MPVRWLGSWEGGRIRATGKGTSVWMIERRIEGERYAISLDVTTESQALTELAIFLKDPEAYKAALEGMLAASTAPLVLNDERIEAFLAWCRSEERDELYVRHVLEKYLNDWAAALKGRDLRKMTTVELRLLLAKWPTAKKNRIIALKAFTGWCRNETGLLTTQTDPTLDLKSAKPKKKRAEDEGKAYDRADVEAAYRAIDFQLVRDQVVMAFKFGLHLRELERWGKGQGKLRDVGPWDGCPIVATLTVQHKNGDPHTVSLDAQGRAAALRLRAAGGASRSWAYQHLAEVAARHQLPHLLLGSGRHSFVTWCRTPGLGVKKHEPPQPAVSLQDVMVVTGHRTQATPRHHYDEAQHIPHLLELPLRLVHPDDPPVDQVVKLAARRRADPQ